MRRLATDTAWFGGGILFAVALVTLFGGSYELGPAGAVLLGAGSYFFGAFKEARR